MAREIDKSAEDIVPGRGGGTVSEPGSWGDGGRENSTGRV